MRTLAVVTSSCVILAGCGEALRVPTAKTKPIEPVNTGLDLLAHGDAETALPDPTVLDPRTPAAWEQAALDLQRLLDEAGTAPRVRETDNLSTPQPTERMTVAERGVERTEPTEDAAAASPVTEERDLGKDHAAEAAQEVVEDAEARLDRLMDEVVGLLRARVREGAPVDVLRLAFLEALSPGAIGSGAGPDRTLTSILTPVEIAQVLAARDLVREWQASFARGSADGALSALEAGAQAISEASPGLVISTVALCERVDGFGSYTPFVTTTFVAGQSNEIIVYTELDRFAHRAVRSGDVLTNPGDTLATEISQLLTLYHDGPGQLQAWHQPRARVTITSRRPRKECFLVNQIVLPANLSVGSYRLKILTRDEVSGAEAEAFVPIRMVADHRLVHEAGR
ncbi:MAG: hypothetical protein KF866_07485 [Phycisphaeraceae bacterium]|nr:hypothetical protein [Phycisphaeraceae bacterium]MCW5753722.1 hypothetical protein [Phycisphaeraceae bacterium]